ncbi:type 1 fimbrial protein [Salmonella enterica]|nr:type 1 fimbrial protein [Salmonella enterica]
MKKTLMAGMVALCAMSGMNAAQAAAAISGTQTFKANITDTTCTIANVNRAVDLGAIPRTQATANGVDVVSDVPFNITGCGASISTASVTADYTEDGSGTGVWGMMKNSGTATLQGILKIVTAGVTNENTAHPGYVAPGKKITNSVVNGASQFNFAVQVMANSHKLSNLKSGSVEYPVTLTFDFT